MKLKRYEVAVIIITLLFISFTAGFFSGRGSAGGEIRVEQAGSISVSRELPRTEEIAGDKKETININTAGLDELTGISGVGEVIAGRIIEYREKNGPFTVIEEIMNVKGIGEKMFNNIKGSITV